MTEDDINDGDLCIFKGGVESIGNEFSIIDGVEDNGVIVVSAVDIDDGLEASIFVISRFRDMFEFINAFMVLCNLPFLFVDGEVVIGADAVRSMVMCSASMTTMAMATTTA